jgi:hypothetical protein
MVAAPLWITMLSILSYFNRYHIITVGQIIWLIPYHPNHLTAFYHCCPKNGKLLSIQAKSFDQYHIITIFWIICQVPYHHYCPNQLTAMIVSLLSELFDYYNIITIVLIIWLVQYFPFCPNQIDWYHSISIVWIIWLIIPIVQTPYFGPLIQTVTGLMVQLSRRSSLLSVWQRL